LTRADHYLAKFNGNLPQLQKDWQITAGFSQVYAGAAPNIASTVTNLGVTSRTLADGNWDPVLRSVVPAADSVGAFFGTAGKALSDALYSLYPTTSLLHDYAPEFTCFLDGSAKTYDTLNRTFVDESGIHFELTPVFGQPAYQYPNDLPEMPGPGPQVGPNCRGLPAVGEHELSMADYTTGPQSVRNTSGHQLSVPRQPAVVQFFGPNAILPSAVTGHELKPSKGSK
jgi:phospholipid/cholesterol/gamma-HCH transport system substrate-binding protein